MRSTNCKSSWKFFDSKRSALQQVQPNGYFSDYRLRSLASKVTDKFLQEYVLAAVSCHSAEYDFKGVFQFISVNCSDRKVIEEGFLAGDIVILCTTTTLSQGVNLPAGLVVIKGTMGSLDERLGTQLYIPGTGFQEYSELTIIQMMGRAGRPNFDTWYSLFVSLPI